MSANALLLRGWLGRFAGAVGLIDARPSKLNLFNDLRLRNSDGDVKRPRSDYLFLQPFLRAVDEYFDHFGDAFGHFVGDERFTGEAGEVVELAAGFAAELDHL